MTDSAWMHARELERSRREAGPPAGRYRSADKRFAVLRAIMIGALVLSLVYLVYDALIFPIIDAARTGDFRTDTAETYDAIGSVLSIVWFFALAAYTIAIFAWLSRSVDNTPALTGRRPISSPRMSIVWWFIPFANFVQPFRILRDLRENMAQGPVGAGLVLGWWLAFLGTGILSYITFGLPYSTLEEIATVGAVSVVTDILFIVEFLLGLRLFGGIQRDAEAQAATSTQSSAGAASTG